MNTTATNSDSQMPTTVVDWIDLSIRRDPDEPAVRFGDEVLTYSAMGVLVHRVASNLRARGIGRGDRVGIRLQRSIEAVVSPIAVMKAGATYVPLDPSYPDERLTVMQREADLSCLIVHDKTQADLDDGPTVVTWSELLDTQATEDTDVAGSVEPEDVAYVIFTSGSTGVPKGVEMPHRALSNLIGWQLERSSFRPGATVLQFSSLSFDVSFQEIATTMASGGCLVVTTDEQRRDPRTYLRMLSETGAQRIFVPFVVLRNLADAALSTSVPKLALREVITAGEQLRVDDALRQFFTELDGATLDNQYGPSETHVITAHLLGVDPHDWPELPPIGEPVDGCSVRVMDEQLRPTPQGEVGQIYLGGEHLAHGYFRRPDLTEQSFITHQADGGSERLYASGDLGDIDENGQLHYRGRADDQVKIRGHRVEPAEVDGIAEQLAEVSQSRTVARVKPSGNAFLTSYVVLTPGDNSDSAAIRQKMAERLPPHLVPAFVIVVDGLPRSPSGKVNLRELPDPQSSQSAIHIDYLNSVEEKLASIWREVLGFPGVPRDVSFFDLGGDSLDAATLFVRITDELATDLPLATLVQAPTIAELAEEITAHRHVGDGFRSLQLLRQGSAETAPLFLVHGGAGNVLLFAQIAVNLSPEQTVYGMQWSGWDGHRGESTVQEMAAAYVSEIRRVRPVGPYRLGGHCLGGLIALEMARLLTDAGEIIDQPIVVSDAPNLAAASYRAANPHSNDASKASYTSMCARLLDAVPSSLRSGDWRGDVPEASAEMSDPDQQREPKSLRSVIRSIPGAQKFAQHARAAITRWRVRIMLAAGRTIPMGWRLGYCQQTLRPAARKYTPRPYDGDVLYFRTATTLASNMALQGWWDDIYMGFGEICAGRFEAHVVGGEHNAALMTPEAADLIRAAFDR